MSQDNSGKHSETIINTTQQQLNAYWDRTPQKSLFNPHVAHSFKSQEVQILKTNTHQIENSSNHLLDVSNPTNKDKPGSEYSQICQKMSYFSKKTLTLNRPRGRQATSKEEAQPKEWAEALYKKEEASHFGKILLKMRYIDYAVIFFSFLSILFALIDNELYIKNNQALLDSYHINDINPIDLKINDYLYIQDRVLLLDENIIRSLNLVSSVVLSISILMDYCLRVELLKMENKLSKYEGFASSGLMVKMTVEMVLSLIFFPPVINVVYFYQESNSYTLLSLNNVFNALALVKFYFLFRITGYCLKWNKKVAQTIAKSHRIRSGIVFSLKCELKERPFITLIYSCLFFIVICGLITRSFEYLALNVKNGLLGTKGINDMRDVFTTFWMIITTMTGIGFGDNTPRTVLGRMMGFASSVFGLLFICLVIVTISSHYSDLTHEEAKAFLKLKKLHHRDNKDHKSANVIRLLLCLRKLYCLHIEDKTHRYYNEAFALFSLLITHIKLMKNDYKISNSYATPITDIFKAVDEKVTENISAFSKSIDELNDIETDMVAIESNHKETEETLGRICGMQSEIAMWLLNAFNEIAIKKKARKKGRKVTRRDRNVSGTIQIHNKALITNCLAACEPQIKRRYSFKQKKSIILEEHRLNREEDDEDNIRSDIGKKEKSREKSDDKEIDITQSDEKK